MVAEIERRGYVERAADPTDGRAILIRHTPAGRTLLRDALAEMADIESGYERIIGTDAMATVKHALRAIAEATDPATALGR
jgi:DNA-binding MarR family transcriptional regulator